ncbi:MAG: hypothetical protein OES09_18225, partial [Gammaproteobacteria bacterium]|nr:hypothetical protein [Gammaproteobacteria bacterium]
MGILVAAIWLVACAQAPVLVKPGYQRPPGDIRVLLMPIDIELSTLTVGGVTEPRADWTKTARGLVADALDEYLAVKDAEILVYRSPDDAARTHAHNQLVKLHGVVGTSLFWYTVAPAATPPTIKNKFDWSLGEEAVALGDEYDAQYALFVYLRDTYATGGRKALMVGAALLGVGIGGGTQIGFASLVDLQSGNMVWFNELLS